MCQFSMLLTVPNILWLGVHPSDIQKLSFHKKALLPFTKKDVELASGLLQRPYVINNEVLKKEVCFNFRCLQPYN
jgi:meiotic recombination protein SPO11